MEEATVIQDSGCNVGNIINPAVFPEFFNANFLVQFWKGSYKTDSLTGRSYFELRIDPNQTFHINGCDEGERDQLLHYMNQSTLCTIISYDNIEGQREGGVISRVFWTGSPEMSPNISYYSEDEYPHRDFALSCGIRASFCFPFFNINHDFGWPDGVVEIVSTCNQGIGPVRKICESFEGLGLCLPGFLSTNIQKNVIPEMDHLLDVVCQTFRFPLAQYWVAPDLFESLSMVRQISNRNFESLAPWSQFKDACWHKSLTVGEGPLGNSCTSHEAFFCKDVSALSITYYPFAHYARNCGSISCFTVFLCSNSLPYTTCALEFFLPSQEMDNYYPQSLLNSLWATMKERLPNHILASGKQLGQGLSVGVINSPTHNEPAKSFEIGQPDSSLPHHEGSGYTCTLNMFENGTAQRSNSNSYEEAATEETLKTIPNEVTVIITEKPEDESHIKYIGPHSLASQPKGPINILQYEGNSNPVMIDHSALETTLEEPSKLKSHTTTAERDKPVEALVKDIGDAINTASKEVEKFTEPIALESLHNHFLRPLDDAGKSFEETVEGSNVENGKYAMCNVDVGCVMSNTDDGCAPSNADVGYATTTASQPSRFLTMNMPRQLVEEVTMVLENEEESHVKCIEHRSLTPQLRRSEEIFGDEGNSTVMMAHSTVEMTLEELVKHREHTVASKRVSKQVEKSPMSDKDVGHTTSIVSRPFISRTMISKPEQGFQKKIIFSENSEGKVTLSEDDTLNYFENETSKDAHTSKRERKSKEEISFENLREHFGRPLDNAATSFGVSRSTFKRICRDFGIKRWQHRKRRMDDNISSKLTGNVTPVHDTVDAHSGQDLNKMTVKVTYKGINIRFKLPDLSGIAELENNVIERLHLERKSFSIKYQDDEGDWVLIACDKDVQECVEISRLLKRTTIKLLLDPPIDYNAP